MQQRVLAIDDSPDIHRLLDVRLRPEALTLEHALDAESGIQKAQERQFDLILLDVAMPQVDGFDVCARLKQDPATQGTPIIFLSAATTVFDKVRGFDLGAVDYVTKPFDGAELRARVRAALRTKRYQDLLAARSQIDALTGIFNRAYFDRRIEEELAATKRYGRKVSLVVLDVDHFKSLNDGQGHPFGDRVLQNVGELLTVNVRATDAACRYGGDEFAIILSETDRAGAADVAERLRGSIAKLELGAKVAVTSSVGYASTETFLARELTSLGLFSAADSALYEAKRAGRNCVRGA